MDFSARYVALGDSFTEGVGDDDAARPNGVRGWADLTAEQLARGNEGFGYANLAIRGRKLRQVMAEQVDAAVALKPTLVTLYAGANDILRPKVDIDSLVEEYDAGIARLSATGATVVLFTGFDSRNSKVFATTRGRTAIYNELVREVAEQHGALLVDYWRFGEYNDPRMWAQDRMHMSTAGHANMAKRVLAVLEQDDAIEVPALAQQPEASRAEALRANARWVREFAGPWVVRRVRRRSSGDGLRPKYATLTRPLSLPVIP
ncbi:SGNH/GDSL hydrolase family protein [Arthrobacter cavernae]|uniref:SGNH/GDSL hydrolase family protein n=1 Tax=Arthrobacter cavernae TaxID=2817681 RepID=A0A939KKQ7_9MICC|nr:SGNH/GDSL hydrolase family protein [Arthrobacter cavernae]MBO1269982.1 SGNH/GDSL hydrolase family protein [Arthrobacter cavernae]